MSTPTAIENHNYHPFRRLFTERNLARDKWYSWITIGPFVLLSTDEGNINTIPGVSLTRDEISIKWEQLTNQNKKMELMIPVPVNGALEPMYGRIEYNQNIPMDFTLAFTEWDIQTALGLLTIPTGRVGIVVGGTIVGAFIPGEQVQTVFGTTTFISLLTSPTRLFLDGNIAAPFGTVITGLTSGATAVSQGVWSIEFASQSPFKNRAEYFRGQSVGVNTPFTFAINRMQKVKSLQSKDPQQLLLSLQASDLMPPGGIVILKIFAKRSQDIDSPYHDIAPRAGP